MAKLVILTNMEHSCRKKDINTKSLEDIFQDVNKKHVKIRRKDRKNNNMILFCVLDELLKIMRNQNTLFNNMKPKLQFLGSYFDGLRVGEPTEYDINVILTIHVDYKKISLNASESQHSSTSIIMPAEFRRLSKTPATADKGFKDTELWCDNKYRLSVKKFRSWMQCVVDAALNTLPHKDNKKYLKVNNKYYTVECKTSGPANTITIYIDENNVIDIDLVPTLSFKLPKKPCDSTIDFRKAERTQLSCYFAVPKPNDKDYSWRLAFPYQERYYIKNKGNLKSTLKLIKLLRDVQEFNKLASYFIKTLFLWEVMEMTDDFWKNNSLSYLVLYMMRKLIVCLDAGTIKNFWSSDHNLLENIKPETCKNWANRLSNILRDIEHNRVHNPHIVLKYFGKKKQSLI